MIAKLLRALGFAAFSVACALLWLAEWWEERRT